VSGSTVLGCEGEDRRDVTAASTVATTPAMAITVIGPFFISSTAHTRPQKNPPIPATLNGMITRSGIGWSLPRFDTPRAPRVGRRTTLRARNGQE
jgi:hypothetical protein